MTAVGEAWLDSFCSWPGGHKSSKPEEYFLLHLEVGSAYWWTLDLVVTHGNIVVLFLTSGSHRAWDVSRTGEDKGCIVTSFSGQGGF